MLIAVKTNETGEVVELTLNMWKKSRKDSVQRINGIGSR